MEKAKFSAKHFTNYSFFYIELERDENLVQTKLRQNIILNVLKF